MNPAEFEKRLMEVPVEAPDQIDHEMLREASKINDGSTISLDELRAELENYSGKLVIRIPRSLHKALKEAADVEGVSLNQYMLYKLSR